MSVIYAPRQTTLDERQLFTPALIALAMLAFLGRLWYLQVVQVDELRAMGISTGVDRVKRLAPRGRILDRNGVVIAGVTQNAVVTAVYDTVKDHPEAIEEVARLLGVPRERLDKPLKEASWDPYVSSVIWVGVSPEAASVIAEAGDRLPGFGVVLQPTRTYYEPLSMTHVLGYVWKPTEREVKRLKASGIEPLDYVGRDGLEMTYEELLMGAPGVETMAVDPQMRPIRTISIDRPVPGDELTLAIDLRLQRLALELLGKNRGAVVASDPRTGEILCMVGTPSYDIHLFDNGISQTDYDLLNTDPGLPFLKRPIAGIYPPGSTFKIVTSIAAQLAGVFNTGMVVHCPGYYRIGTRRVGCLSDAGTYNFHTAMAKSCNTYFIELAMRAGPDHLREACALLGIGERQGIDIPGEASGIIPTRDWIERTERTWRPGDTANMGIGQGYVTLTPLQMLSVVTAVANRGRVYEPHVLRSSKNANGKVAVVKPETIADIDLPESFWQSLSSALVSVIDAGTAGSARINGLQWGGKTGSAQNSSGPMAHGWFVGYAPANDPRIAISVIVENAGHGGVVAAPIAREIVNRYLNGDLERIPQIQSSVRPAASSRTSSAEAVSPDSR